MFRQLCKMVECCCKGKEISENQLIAVNDNIALTNDITTAIMANTTLLQAVLAASGSGGAMPIVVSGSEVYISMYRVEDEPFINALATDHGGGKWWLNGTVDEDGTVHYVETDMYRVEPTKSKRLTGVLDMVTGGWGVDNDQDPSTNDSVLPHIVRFRVLTGNDQHLIITLTEDVHGQTNASVWVYDIDYNATADEFTINATLDGVAFDPT